MMLEIFRALRTLQFEWKIVAQYALKCRPCPRAAALPPHEARPPASNRLLALARSSICTCHLPLAAYYLTPLPYYLAPLPYYLAAALARRPVPPNPNPNA